jgi:hypothetical protein
LTTLAIAGWRIRLCSTSPWFDEAIAARYKAFVVLDGGKPDASVTMTLEPDMPGGQQRGYAITRDGEVCLLDMPHGCGTINLSGSLATLALKRQYFWRNLEFSLKALLAYLAFRRGGLLFHCAGVLADGEVYLFTGEGGSGKSTVVSLSPDKVALNDDLVVLRRDGPGWRAYGTPFWNEEATHRDGQTSSGPVAGILKLVQDQQVYLEPVSAALAAGELTVNCPTVNIDPVELPDVIYKCRELAEAVTMQRLHFRKSPGFWDLLQRRNVK